MNSSYPQYSSPAAPELVGLARDVPGQFELVQELLGGICSYRRQTVEGVAVCISLRPVNHALASVATIREVILFRVLSS